MSKRVAVWLTNFNNAKHIAKAIESVLAQDYKDYVLYVFDNHSTDTAPQVIANYAHMYPSVIEVVQMPEGLAGIPAMKHAWDFLNETSHEFSITLGGHDYWEQAGHLQTLVSRYDGERSQSPDPIALVYTDTWQVNEDGAVVGRFNNILQSGGNMGKPFVPQWVVTGIDCPPFFGLWNESIRKQVPVRHQCAGFDHLVVTHAATKGHILWEPRVVLRMRAPVPGSSYTKHFSKAALQGKHQDFLDQIEWLTLCVDEACEGLGAAQNMYRAMLTTSMFAEYVCLRGYNLNVFPGGVEAFNADPAAREALGACMQANAAIRKLIGQ